MVAALGRALRAILVAGPPISGVSAVASALASASPDHHVIEWPALTRSDRPDAVVFVVTAAAPMTRSQAALFESVLAATGPVPAVGAVSKIDLHRGWADVLEANRGMLSDRCRALQWVGVAAEPDIGPPCVQAIVDVLRGRPRPIELRPRTVRNVPPSRPAAASRTEEISRRAELARVRLRLNARIRADCAELRVELRRQAAEVGRRDLAVFAQGALEQVARAVGRWDQAMTAEFDAILLRCGGEAASLPVEPLPAITATARRPDRRDPAEVRLTGLVGAAFGTGTALTVGRLLSDLVAHASSVVGAAVGLTLGLWVIRTRLLLSERTGLQRWAAELTAAARLVLEERVAIQALAVDVELSAVSRRTAAPQGTYWR